MIAAGIDLGFARDASAMVLVGGEPGDRLEVLGLLEVRGGEASDPRAVVDAFAATLEGLGVWTVMADCHYRQLLAVELAERGVTLRREPAGADGKARVYLHARRVLGSGLLAIPPHPLRDRLARQLRDTRGRPSSGGGFEISHGRSDGGHGDLVSALVLALWQLRMTDAAEPVGIAARTAGFCGVASRRWLRDGEEYGAMAPSRRV